MTQIVLAPTPEDSAAEKSREHPVRWVWRQLRANAGAALGGVVFVALVIIGFASPWLAPYGPDEAFSTGYEPPSPEHWLGLNDVGNDLLSQIMYGTRSSLLVGFGAAFLAIAVGTVLGLAAGYWGGRTDGAISSVTDFFLVIPEVPLMMVIAAVWGQGLWKMTLIIGILLWTWTVRVIRAQVMSVKERVYVRRAKALGGSDWRVITRHVLPQVAPLIIVNFVLTVAVAIFDESALSFLGLGDPRVMSLGRILDEANQGGAATLGAWWAFIPAGAVIAILILSLTLMGQAVEDALNPRLRVSYLSRKHFLLMPNRRTNAPDPRSTPGRSTSEGEVA